MSSPPPPIRRIQHVGIKVRDMDEAVAFYREVMGFRVSDRYEPGDNPHSQWGICFMRCGDLHHEISVISYAKEENPQPPRESLRDRDTGLHHVAFQVDSREEFDLWVEHIRSKEIEIVGGPVVHSPVHPEGNGTLGENRAFYFHDPSGNGIEIFCDMAPIDEGTNRVNEAWFRDRLERDGHPRDSGGPPPAWAPGVSSMADAHGKFGTKKP